MNSIRIGLLPNEAERDLDSFKKSLESKLDVSVEIVSSKNYSELVEHFKSEKVDFAFFSPRTFVQAEREASAKALLKKVYGDSEFYYSALLGLKSSGIKKISELQAKKLGFVDPKSASGYLYPRMMLQGEGLKPGSYEESFLGTHDKNVEALMAGTVSAIGTWSNDESGQSGAWSKSLQADQVELLQISEPIPNDAFAVRMDFYESYPDLVLKVMDAMIALPEESDVLDRVFGVKRMATATSRHYDPVRKLESLMKDSLK